MLRLQFGIGDAKGALTASWVATSAATAGSGAAALAAASSRRIAGLRIAVRDLLRDDGPSRWILVEWISD